MAFSKAYAHQCIPEFHGESTELDSFIYHIDYFANKIPDGESQEELLHVVSTKLKGPAAVSLSKIVADTWEEVQKNLIKEFGKRIKLEQLFNQIENMEQGPQESFQSYKNRAVAMKELIDDLDTRLIGCDQNAKRDEKHSFGIRSLRIHFLSGLQNKKLRFLASFHKEKTFEELVEHLQDESIYEEQMKSFEKRLNDSKISLNLNQSQQNHFSKSRNSGNINKAYRHHSWPYRRNQAAMSRQGGLEERMMNVKCNTSIYAGNVHNKTSFNKPRRRVYFNKMNHFNCTPHRQNQQIYNQDLKYRVSRSSQRFSNHFQTQQGSSCNQLGQYVRPKN